MKQSGNGPKLCVGMNWFGQMFQDCIEDLGDSVSTVDMNSDCLSRESVRLWYLYPGQSCVSWGKSLVCKPVMRDWGKSLAEQIVSKTGDGLQGCLVLV